MRFRVVAGLAVGMLALGSGAVANASTTAHQNPGSSAAPSAHMQSAISGNLWLNDYNSQDMWYDGSFNQFYTSGTNYTYLSAATACSNGWCEHKLENGPGLGECMAWSQANNDIYAEPCNGKVRQLWSVNSNGNGADFWWNDYATSYYYNHYQCSGAAPYLTVGSYDLMKMSCPEGNNGNPSTSQLWTNLG